MGKLLIKSKHKKTACTYMSKFKAQYKYTFLQEKVNKSESSDMIVVFGLSKKLLWGA